MIALRTGVCRARRRPGRQWSAGLGQASLATCGRHRLTGFVGHQLPQVTDFRLSDPMDATETLLQPVGIPRQVVVDREMGTLEVDAFTGSIGRRQNLNLWIMLKGFLGFQPLFAPSPP